MAKLNLDFVLIDESVVMNGFRTLMSGAKLEAFIANPVMLYMHKRENDEEVFLPIGRWYEIRIEGKKLMAKPDFDESDEFAVKVQGKVKNGYLNAASIWLEPMAVSNDDKLKLAGQIGPTITEWGVLEASIVDIPNCKNALAIRDAAGHVLKLSIESEMLYALNNFTQKNKIQNMDLKLAAVKIGLADTATEAEYFTKLSVLTEKAAKADEYKLTAETAQALVVTMKAEAATKEVLLFVEKAIEDKKILAPQKEQFLKLAAADFESVKTLIDGMQPYSSVQNQLAGEGAEEAQMKATLVTELMKKPAQELFESDGMDQLKAASLPHFKLKYKELTGKDYAEEKA